MQSSRAAVGRFTLMLAALGMWSWTVVGCGDVAHVGDGDVERRSVSSLLRWRATAVDLGDGTVMVVGGIDPDTDTRLQTDALRVDRQSGAITPAGSFSQPLIDVAAANVDGDVLLVGAECKNPAPHPDPSEPTGVLCEGGATDIGAAIWRAASGAWESVEVPDELAKVATEARSANPALSPRYVPLAGVGTSPGVLVFAAGGTGFVVAPSKRANAVELQAIEGPSPLVAPGQTCSTAESTHFMEQGRNDALNDQADPMIARVNPAGTIDRVPVPARKSLVRLLCADTAALVAVIPITEGADEADVAWYQVDDTDVRLVGSTPAVAALTDISALSAHDAEGTIWLYGPTPVGVRADEGAVRLVESAPPTRTLEGEPYGSPTLVHNLVQLSGAHLVWTNAGLSLVR